MYFDYFVMYIRFLTSGYIKTHRPLFEIYFETEEELLYFCSQDVEIIDSEVDQIQIMALFQFFDIPLRIFYIDNSPGTRANCFSLPDLTGNDDQAINSSD